MYTVKVTKNKQIVNIADENITYYIFLSRYHETKSRNYLKRRYRNRHSIPMFLGTPCIEFLIQGFLQNMTVAIRFDLWNNLQHLFVIRKTNFRNRIILEFLITKYPLSWHFRSVVCLFCALNITGYITNFVKISTFLF